MYYCLGLLIEKDIDEATANVNEATKKLVLDTNYRAD